MGSPSSIHSMPKGAKGRLDAALRDPAVTQRAATAAANEELKAEGLPLVSKSAVNRYAIAMAESARRIEQSREIADACVARLGDLAKGKVGPFTIELIRTLSCQAALMLHRRELDPDSMPEFTKALRTLALTMKTAEGASEISERRARQLRADAIEELAREVEERRKAQPRQRLTGDDIRRISVELYGA